jgi:hypothetical protein
LLVSKKGIIEIRLLDLRETAKFCRVAQIVPPDTP